jgi:hypothetical protein
MNGFPARSLPFLAESKRHRFVTIAPITLPQKWAVLEMTSRPRMIAKRSVLGHRDFIGDLLLQLAFPYVEIIPHNRSGV